MEIKGKCWDQFYFNDSSDQGDIWPQEVKRAPICDKGTEAKAADRITLCSCQMLLKLKAF